MTLLVDEACWLRMLPQALTEAEANSEIYRKGLCLICLPPSPLRSFRRQALSGSALKGTLAYLGESDSQTA